MIRGFLLAPGQAQFGEQNDEATAQTEFGAVEEPYEMTVSDQSVARLVIVRPLEVREIKIRKKELMVGRSSKADITVDHEKVSRLHCRLLLNEKDLLDLEDLGSTNGTLFQGANVKKAQLRPNQSFTVGDAKLYSNRRPVPCWATLPANGKRQRLGCPPTENRSARGQVGQRRQRPVIVIPGFLGSELQCNGQVLWPRVKDFEKPRDAQTARGDRRRCAHRAGGRSGSLSGFVAPRRLPTVDPFFARKPEYEVGQNLFPFPWDWRRDLRRAAANGRRIHQLRDEGQISEKVILIGHSAGCQVARYYVERMGGRHYVDRLIFNGRSHAGVAQTAHLGVGFGRVFGWNKERVATVLGSFPGLYQLLPQHECIFHEDGTPFNIWEDKVGSPTKCIRSWTTPESFKRICRRNLGCRW